ncbi:N-acetyltransferase [Capsulimonas corticalis]|uniref:N-acetyltransferase n=1 Tax=Capsulimonas corticalis TaxID=2219043 RepID=A0A402D4K2_9BACT|nr:GNAT family N-acetyltransferase [Capsulimonas corticalis]BDI29266.1 N-acetyltransferase [Capsulimonas corticalis]
MTEIGQPRHYKIEMLTSAHDRRSFESENPKIDDYLKRMALQRMKRHQARTFVIIADDEPTAILGFYTLTMATISFDESPPIYKAPPGKSVTAALLAQMAVAKTYSGKGFARKMVMHCLHNCRQIDAVSGLLAITVDAADENAKSLYLHLGFEVADERDPMRLHMPMDAVIKKLEMD